MTRRTKIRKAEAPAAPTEEEISRLTDMETKEVSLVDRAANKTKFLVVKRDGEGNYVDEDGNSIDPEATESAQVDQPTTQEEDTVIKLADRVKATLTRVQAAKAAIVAAPVSKTTTTLPENVQREALAIQFSLKNMAGVLSKAITLIVPNAIDLGTLGEISKSVKDEATSILTEVENRLTKSIEAIGDATMLDTKQASALDGAADLISKVAAGSPTVIAFGTLTDSQRATLVPEIEKALTSLNNLYLGLNTNVAKEVAAPPANLTKALHEIAAGLEVATSKAVPFDVVVRDFSTSTVESLRSIEKSEDSGELVDVLKAAQMYRVDTDYDKPRTAPDRYKVVLYTEPQQPTLAASFGTRTEAELDAMRRNFELVTNVAKAFGTYDVKKQPNGKWAVMDPNEKSMGEYDDEVECRAKAKEMNRKMAEGATKPAKKSEAEGAAAATAADTDTTPEGQKNEEGAVGATKTETNKVGRPMQGDRLNRLKGAVKLLKEALGDLRGGSVSLEKFKQVGNVLGSIVNELSSITDATKGIVESKGLDADLNTRSGTDPNAANQGSGVQPDAGAVGNAADNVPGDGAESLKSILKRLEAVEKAAGEKDATIAALRTKLTQVEKARTAPSAPPADAMSSSVAKGNDDSRVHWPRDMASAN